MWKTFIVYPNLPGHESEEGSDDEDNIKHRKSNKQPVKGFSELFPPHDNDCESVS